MFAFIIILLVFACIFGTISMALFYGPQVIQAGKRWNKERLEQQEKERLAAEQRRLMPPTIPQEILDVEEADAKRFAEWRAIRTKHTMLATEALDAWEQEFLLETEQSPITIVPTHEPTVTVASDDTLYHHGNKPPIMILQSYDERYPREVTTKKNKHLQAIRRWRPHVASRREAINRV